MQRAGLWMWGMLFSTLSPHPPCYFIPLAICIAASGALVQLSASLLPDIAQTTCFHFKPANTDSIRKALLHEGAPGKSKDKGTVGQCLSSRERQGK